MAQCGGAGNVVSVRRAVADFGDPWEGPWTFATPAETAARLAAAGFVEVETWAHEEPTVIEPLEALETFLATVVLRPTWPAGPRASGPATSGAWPSACRRPRSTTCG